MDEEKVSCMERSGRCRDCNEQNLRIRNSRVYRSRRGLMSFLEWTTIQCHPHSCVTSVLWMSICPLLYKVLTHHPSVSGLLESMLFVLTQVCIVWGISESSFYTLLHCFSSLYSPLNCYWFIIFSFLFWFMDLFLHLLRTIGNNQISWCLLPPHLLHGNTSPQSCM